MTEISWPSPKEFYDQFKDDPESGQKTAFKFGHEMGQEFMRRNGIKGDSLEAVAELLNAMMSTVKCEPSARVDGNKVILRNTGFCLIMRAAMAFDIPWGWIDTNFAWPWLEGIASTVRPDIKMKVEAARYRGDPICIHVFEVE
jgi:hypothetical protein